MICAGNFFNDLYGLQPIIINKKPIENPKTIHLKTEKIYKFFHNQLPQPNYKCLLYLEQIRKLFLTKICNQQIADYCLYQVLQDEFHKIKGPKGILKKFPKNIYDKIMLKLIYITESLPDSIFSKWEPILMDDFDDSTFKINQDPLSVIFLIPMNENEPIIDDEKVDILSMKPDTSNSYKIYPIAKRFEIFKEKLTEIPYNVFKQFVQDGINSTRSDDELLNYFLDVFGCEIFEFCQEIIENRHKTFDWGLKQQQQQNILKKKQRSQINMEKFKNQPTIAGQVTVLSEEEKKLAKTIRKLEKKQDYILDNIKDELQELKHQPIFKKSIEPAVNYPHVYDQLRNVTVITKFNGISFKQPENTIKSETKTHIEFNIPGSSLPKSDTYELVKVSDLDSTGKIVFKDINQFNRIQSEVFHTAYNTNLNMLICAPTGGGKTNIALLAIVHQIRAHMDGGFIRKDDFKIVYICPMKALATEMVTNFSTKLSPIGISVKEVTGDIHLTKKEITETQMLVTTPEKWDVISRKGAVDTEITTQLKLLILDEVHLLNSDRGPVIEALVARTLRQVISNQSNIRIVALSATLPGYLDVANFLKVDPMTGLFFFDNRFRSVPLTMTFIGLKNKNDQDLMDQVCYNKIVPIVKDNNQVMVFVTSRNMTGVVAKNLLTFARTNNQVSLFVPDKSTSLIKSSFKTGDLELLVSNGFGIHHAGMCRHDRLEVESLFRKKVLKVIVCTTTLAWGVNLPAHAVIIRGTTRYDAQKSALVDMDMLDVQQIFGRAGRPQYDTSGHGMIITGVQNMTNYMSLLTSQVPIESQFLNFVPDNLNAEVVLGTVSNLKEAMEWLLNTFLYCRIKKNPLVYGLTLTDIWEEDKLYHYLERKLFDAATTLDNAHMVRFNTTSGELRPTNYGRIASFYYISFESMKLFHEEFHRNMLESDILLLISKSWEFQQIQVRNDELDELDRLHDECSRFEYNLDNTSAVFKVLTLIQANISRARIRVSSLISDCEFVMQSVQRLSRALFEIALDKNYGLQVDRCLLVTQIIEQQSWHEDIHPLLQFKELEIKGARSMDILKNLPIEELREMNETELLNLLRNRYLANRVHHFCQIFPKLDLELNVKPITEGVIRIKLIIEVNFKWDNSIHGNVQHYYAWVEDPLYDTIYHNESFIVTKRNSLAKEPIELIFTVPLTKPHSPDYFVTVVNTKYMFTKTVKKIDIEKLNLLPSYTIQTKFLTVRPLPKTVLHNKNYEDLYTFTHYNAVQSQVFHCCYNTDTNILLGAPTGSGKTIVSEICILRLFRTNPELKVVYIAPMKALVRERVEDWSKKFIKISKKTVEVTGDITPHSSLIGNSNIIITTPEKWDGMSRNWVHKNFVRKVGLIIIDEIHLLAEERGPVLEVIVSRMNYINSIQNAKVRIVGLSTAMANAGDLANWLGIERKGLYNFSSAVRPIPLEIHLMGFNVKHYCPRMAAMNRPAYQVICQYDSPILIFVSSRKQTRITAYDLIKCLLNDIDPKKWLLCPNNEIDCLSITDNDLKYLLNFGIGIHHAGLQEQDRKIVENLFQNRKIQILVATATLAWGVNFPAHVVIIKGTEYYDGATKRYVDMPITDILQMIGRAGRPQYDTSGAAYVFVQENKKNFYRKFLFEPFPVESSLLQVLPEHVNAEIANGTITCKSQLIDFICSTFFFRRLIINPSYYHMEEDHDSNRYLNDLAESVIVKLNELKCVYTDNEQSDDLQDFYKVSFLGQLAAQYYINCKTVNFLNENLEDQCSFNDLLLIICQVEEYSLFPVRHNEDKINKNLCSDLNIKTKFHHDSPHLKVYLLLYCYLFNITLPNQEYVIDLKTVFDQIIRIIQAMISLSSYRSWLDTTIKLVYLNQMLIQGLLINQNPLNQLPYINTLSSIIKQQLTDNNKRNIIVEYHKDPSKIINLIQDSFNINHAKEILNILKRIPLLLVKMSINHNLITLETLNDSITFKSDPLKDCYFQFDLTRLGTNNLNIYSNKFVKQKEESWFYFIEIDGDLQILQRFTIKQKKILYFKFTTPQGHGIYKGAVYFMCDSYIGLDQKIPFQIDVTL